MKQSSLSPEEFAALCSIDQASLDRLLAYEALLRKWQSRINLVGRSTLLDPWRRHFLDSAQLLPLVPEWAGSLVDLGSGAGFPGLVLAILGVPDVHLVESDQRKAAFLREAARVTGTPVTIHAQRIENLSLRSDVVSARALTSLDSLLKLAEPLLREGGVALFLKGRDVDHELTEAGKNWMMEVERIPSLADPESVILKLGAIHRGR